MNKKEFLEILKDYLSKNFSENEVNDILRDYEEYFIDGEIEGKSDLEIISSLGSPKSIAIDLVAEMKEGKHSQNNKKFDKINDSYNKAKLIGKEIFYKSKEVIDEKLTPSLNGEENRFSTKFIKLLLTLLSFILFIPAAVYVTTMITTGILIVAGNIALVAILGTSGPLFSLDKSIGFIIIFASMLIIGFDIIICQIYFWIFKIGKKLFRKYVNWIKTRNLYIKAKEKKQINKDIDLEKYKDVKGDGIDE